MKSHSGFLLSEIIITIELTPSGDLKIFLGYVLL